MTNEEAIKILKAAISEVEWNYPLDYAIAIETATQALEKQIPKKVKREFVTEGGCITCFETDVCPVCGNYFYIEDLGQTMYYSFCPDCGQALDWNV